MTKKETYKISGEDLVAKVKYYINEGNVRKIRIIGKDGKVIAEFPITIGVVGAVIAPILAAVGTIAALISECTIEIEKD